MYIHRSCELKSFLCLLYMVGIVFVGITPQRFYMADCSLPQIMVSVVAGAIWTLVLYENGLILICAVG